MKFLVLQHVPFEDLAYIGEYLDEHQHTYQYCRLYGGETIPAPREFDGLFIMGGPMNIYEDNKYSWLLAERKYIRRFIEIGKPAIGICLGAQLLSDALGGMVMKNEHKEIGWYPINITPDGLESPLLEDIPERITVFHWHGDTFQLPPGAELIFTNQTTRHQGFLFDKKDIKVLGLQFHMEYTPQSIEKMIEYCSDEMVNAPYIMNEEEILESMEHTQVTKKILYRLLNNLFSQWLL